MRQTVKSKKYGNIVRKFRRLQGYSLRSFSDALKIVPSYLCQIEKDGKIPSPTLGKKIRFLLAPEVPVLCSHCGSYLK